MSTLPPASKINEAVVRNREDFEELRDEAQPFVLRGFFDEWPIVTAACRAPEKVAEYVQSFDQGASIRAIAAAPSQKGRFFYSDDCRSLNFVRADGKLADFLADIIATDSDLAAPAMAVQSLEIHRILPGFDKCHTNILLPDIAPRMWISNRARVAPHYDIKENLAVCAAGRRRFTMFPPEQIHNLYPGPFELTPAGTPVSMVDLAAPDLERHPNFLTAWGKAQQAELEPGDAIYIPYCWWHAVEALETLNILINYWWNVSSSEAAHPYDGLLHAMLAFRDLPPNQKDVWRSMLEYYVFSDSERPAAHLPEDAAGVLGPIDSNVAMQMRAMLMQSLQR